MSENNQIQQSTINNQQSIYQIYPPPIDTLVTGMVVATVATVVRAVATVGTAAAATEVRAAPVVGGTKPHWQQRPIFHLSAASFPNF